MGTGQPRGTVRKHGTNKWMVALWDRMPACMAYKIPAPVHISSLRAGAFGKLNIVSATSHKIRKGGHETVPGRVLRLRALRLGHGIVIMWVRLTTSPARLELERPDPKMESRTSDGAPVADAVRSCVFLLIGEVQITMLMMVIRSDNMEYQPATTRPSHGSHQYINQKGKRWCLNKVRHM